MAKRKKLSQVWPNHTADEQRAITVLSSSFGTITYISREQFTRPWQRVSGASTDRCPDCMTYWDPKRYPKCGWCGERAS